MRVPQSIAIVAHTGDHHRLLAGMGNAIASPPPIRVLVGWEFGQGR